MLNNIKIQSDVMGASSEFLDLPELSSAYAENLISYMEIITQKIEY